MISAELKMPRLWLIGGVVLALIICMLSLLPISDTASQLFPFGDKVNHMLAFTALMVWFSGPVRSRFYPLLFVALAAYGGLIEVLQHFSSYRYMELGDLLADAAGALIGWGLALAGLNQWCFWIERRLTRS